MNYNERYSSITTAHNINLDNQKSKIKDNEIQTLISMISELQNRRNEAVKALSTNLYFRNLYRGSGSVLSTNGSLDDDFNKSIEYEAILTISLELIKNNKKNIWLLHIIFIINIWSLIIYILKEYYNYI
jgi:hypothetical protein